MGTTKPTNVILIIMVIGFCTVAERGWGDSIRISGTVRDASGNPVADDGTVAVRMPGELRPSGTAKIQNDGSYTVTFEGTDEPTVDISANHDKQAGVTTKIVRPGNNTADVPVKPLDPPKKDGSGGGRTDPPIGPPSSHLQLSRDRFESFNFTQAIQLTDSVTVRPQLLDFHVTADLMPGTDPNTFQMQVSRFDFQYAPFDLPGTSFAGVDREVLDTSQLFFGLLDTAEGRLFLPTQTQWLTTTGSVAARSLEFFDVSIAQVSPTLVDITFDSSGTFNIVPEPATLILVGTGLAGIAVCRRKGPRNRGHHENGVK